MQRKQSLPGLRRRPDSNWCMTVLQTAPLPLGYDALKKPPVLIYILRSSMLKMGGGCWAKDRIWTDDPNVGNVMLYQLSYFRNSPKIQEMYVTRNFSQIANILVIWDSITIMIMPNIFLILSRKYARSKLWANNLINFKFSIINNL